MGDGVGIGGGHQLDSDWSSGMYQCVSIWCELRAYGMKPPFASAEHVLTPTAMEFVINKMDADRIVTMSGVDISRYA